MTPSGGVVFSGSALLLLGKWITPTSGLAFAGSGLGAKGKVFGVSGGITFGGTGDMTSNTGGGGTGAPERTKVGVGT